MAGRRSTSKVSFGTNRLSALWWRELELWTESGRLTRGKKYFSEGNIRSLAFYGPMHRIDAQVAGSYYNDYLVDYQIEPFNEFEQQKLRDLFTEHPAWLDALRQRMVPEDFVPYCDRVGISLYPSVMRYQCNCPDSGNPCKHAVAVSLAVIHRLDEYPIELFRLKGFDLDKQFPRHATAGAPSATLDAILAHDYTAGAIPFADIREALEAELPNVAASVIEPYARDGSSFALSRKLLHVLYEVSSLEVSKDEERLEEERPLWDNGYPHGLWLRLDRFNTFPVLRYDSLGPSWVIVQRDEGNNEPVVKSVPPKVVWEELDRLTLAKCEVHPHYALLKHALVIAMSLAKAGAMYPVAYRVGQSGEGRAVLWLPATMIEVVARQIATLQSEVEAQREGWRAFIPHHDERAALEDTSHYVIADTERNEALLLVSMALQWCIARSANRYPTFQLDPQVAPLYFAEGSASQGPDFVEECDRFFRPYSLSSLERPYLPVITVRRRTKDTLGVSLGILMKSSDAQDANRGRIEDTPEDALAQKPVSFRDVLQKKDYEAIRFDVLGLAQQLGQLSPIIQSLVKNEGKDHALDKDELTPFLFDQVPSLVFYGVRVRLPKSLRNYLRPQLHSEFQVQGGLSVLNRSAVLDFNWKVALGNTEITQEDFLTLSKEAGKVVPWGDEFVYLEPETIARMKAALESPRQVGRIAAIAAAQTGSYQGYPARVTDDIVQEIERLNQHPAVSLPVGLKATLRPYQERGFAWLHKNSVLGLGSLIADDMGLGKTMQVIALLLKLKEEGRSALPHLLIVPTTLIANWQHELSKFAPSLRFHVYHGPNRQLERDTDIVITSYGTARLDIERLAALPWQMIVLDEAQAVKNTSTSVSQALKQLRAEGGLIAMTGTPVENRLMEYWSIFSLVEPGLLGSQKYFQETFALPIERDQDPEALERFKLVTAPFMLRRVKTDKAIIADLPDKILVDRFVSLNTEQAALYQATLNQELKSIEQSEATQTKAQQRIRLMALMTKLKQICNSVSQFKDVPQKRPVPDSGKGEVLMDILQEAQDNQQKVLIFTQYVQMGERLQDWIEAASGVRPAFLNGTVPVKKRAEMVDAFQTDDAVRVMIISLKAGGTGLNLTRATVVVHYDLWWNPAVENQATDRAYRIGQTKDVTVYRLITRGTFEERINDMLNEKRNLADMTVTVGESWIGDLSKQELKALFELATDA